MPSRSRLLDARKGLVVSTPYVQLLQAPPPKWSSAQTCELRMRASSQHQRDGKVEAPTHKAVIQQGMGAGGFVDTTPRLSTFVSAFPARGRQLRADEFAVATPLPFVLMISTPRSFLVSQAQQDVCAGGSVATTPERRVASSVIPHTRIISAWEDWSVVTTPDAAARATESSAPCPEQIAWSFTSQAALLFDLQGTHGSGSVGGAPHPSVPVSEWGKLHLCHMVSATWSITDALAALHRSCSAPKPEGPEKATTAMSVTAFLQRMTDWVSSDAPLPDHSAWAPVFYGLDQAWARTHGQTLSTPRFVQTLTTYILIQKQVAPSSDSAVHIREVVNSVAKVRIKLLHARGDTYGMTPAGSEQVPQGTSTGATASADQLSPAERLSLLTEVLTDMEAAYQDRVNRLHKDLAECMEDQQQNLLEVLENFLHSAETLSTTHLRDLYSHLSVCLARAPPSMQGANLRRALESRLREGGLSDDWIRSRFMDVADRVTGGVQVTACKQTASRAQARESVWPSGGLSECSATGGHQHGSTQGWFAVLRTTGSLSAPYPVTCVGKTFHCGPTRDRQAPQTNTRDHTLVVSHAPQVQRAKLGHPSPGQTLSKALRRNRSKKARHVAGHQLALTSCGHESKRQALHMMCPPHYFKVPSRHSQKGWPKPGQHMTHARALSGSPFPSGSLSALVQVPTAAPSCSTLPATAHEASHPLLGFAREPSRTVLQHVRSPSLRPYIAPRGGTRSKRFPAYAVAVTSQKLFVVFHTAHSRGCSYKKGSCHLPRPSSNRPGGSLNTFGCQALPPQGPSRRLARKLKHATTVASRAGSANTRASKDAEQGLRLSTSGRHKPGTVAGTAPTSRKDGKPALPAAPLSPGILGPPRPPQLRGGGQELMTALSGWTLRSMRRRQDSQPQILPSLRTSETDGWLGPLPRRSLLYRSVAHPTCRPLCRANSGKRTRMWTRGWPRVRGFPHPATAARMNLWPAYASAGRSVFSDSEELIPANDAPQAADRLTMQPVGAFSFPAPASGARGEPADWNGLPVVHVNKQLLKWWQYLEQTEATTPTAEEFLQSFFRTRPIAQSLRKADSSLFEGFEKFLVCDERNASGTQVTDVEEQLTGYHGTHLHTLWSITRAGMAESGPGLPGSRFFQVPKSDGTTVDVAGTYCFQQALHYKSLNYAIAVLLQEHNVPRNAGPTAIRLVVEISFFRSDICKRGKQTDQCIVRNATIRAIHVQVAPARTLPLGSQTMEWHPNLEASPEGYTKLIEETQMAITSEGGDQIDPPAQLGG